MNKEEFLKLSLEEQVDYINGRLQEGVSFNQVVRDLNVPKTTVFNRINKYYRKEGNAYVPIEALSNHISASSAGSSSVAVPGDRLGMSPHIGMMKEILFSVRKLENEFEEMKHQKTSAEPAQASGMGRSSTFVQSSDLVVDLPKSIANYASFQVNKEVLSRWYSFIRHQHGYSSTDLVSMALKEFMDRYQ